MVTEHQAFGYHRAQGEKAIGGWGAGLQKVCGLLINPLNFVIFAWGSEITCFFSAITSVSALLRNLSNPKYCPEAVRLESQCPRSLWPQEGAKCQVCYNSFQQSFMTGTHWSIGKATQGHPTSDHHAISCTDKLVLVYIASQGQSVFTLQMICVSKSCHPKLNSRKGRNIMLRVYDILKMAF